MIAEDETGNVYDIRSYRAAPRYVSEAVDDSFSVDDLGGGGGGRGMWQQSVENRLNTLHSDIGGLRSEIITRFDAVDRKIDDHRDRQDAQLKWLLGIMATGFLGLAGLMAHGFKWIG